MVCVCVREREREKPWWHCIKALLSPRQSKDKMKRGSRRGCFRLKRSIIGIDDEDDSTFTIGVDNRTYHFQGTGDIHNVVTTCSERL